jgi:iron complex outermembrane receptor protein
MIKPSGNTTRKKALALAIGWTLAGTHVYAQEPTAASGDGAIEEVVVKGVRASQAKAIDIKRESANVVDSIVAEDIGKLPDTTITDSLQRVTGVQIKREANEGTSLNIRGMPQVLTTLNGEQFLSPWNITDVGANYSDVPASMIRGVDVYKSQSASAIPGGISGVVDLKTISPLSLEAGLTANLKLEAAQGSRSDKEMKSDGSTKSRTPDDNINIFLGYKFNDRIAVTAGAYTSSTYNANYQMSQTPIFGFLDQLNGTPIDPSDINGNGDLVNDWYLVPTSFGAESSFMEREREGGSVSLEVELNDHFTLRGDVFYTKMDQFDRYVKAGFDGENTPWSYSYNENARSPDNTFGEEYTDLAPDVKYKEGKLYNVILPGSIFNQVGQFSYVDDAGQQQIRNLQALRVAEVFSPAFTSTSGGRINRTGAINSNIQLDYNNQDNIKASVRYIYAEAEKETRSASLQQGTPAWHWVDEDGANGKDKIKPYRVSVDYRGEFPSFSYEGDLADASNLTYYQANATGNDTEATLNVFRTDLNYAFNKGVLASVDVGLRYGVRDAEYREFFYVTPTGRYGDDQRIPLAKREQLYSGNQVWQRYPDFRTFDYTLERQTLRDAGLYDNGFRANDPLIVPFSDFGPFKGFEKGIAAVNPAAWDNPLDFMNRLYPGTKTVDDPAYAYKVEEASTAGYVQLNLDDQDGVFGIPYSGNIGLHVMRTDREVDRNKIPEVLDIYNSIGEANYQKLAFVYDVETQERSFTQILPSVNLNFFPTEDVVLRLGVAKTTSRNNLENVGSGLSLWLSECEKTDENGNRVLVVNGSGQLIGDTVTCTGGGNDKGNIDIKPWEATVYNTAAEWYFAENSILGAGLFMIDVDTAVQTLQERRNFIDADGIDRGNTGNVWVSENVKASKLYGVEMGYKQPFTFLPGFLSATGIEFNYTYSESDSGDNDLYGKSLPLQSNSKHQSNMILWYDKDGLNVRLAYNWKSEEYDGRVGLNTSGQPINLGSWIEPTGYLDLSVNYWVNDHLSFSLSGTNLTEESKKSYSQFEDQFQSIWVQERRYAAGITFTY